MWVATVSWPSRSARAASERSGDSPTAAAASIDVKSGCMCRSNVAREQSDDNASAAGLTARRASRTAGAGQPHIAAGRWGLSPRGADAHCSQTSRPPGRLGFTGAERQRLTHAMSPVRRTNIGESADARGQASERRFGPRHIHVRTGSQSGRSTSPPAAPPITPQGRRLVRGAVRLAGSLPRRYGRTDHAEG
jgi:hypothetical protein